ncbi:MAG: bifunctional DNA-formamidopyrimidine glycosylase/DNA-(apurinic or apyrimidinic site) lyase [Moorellaceae bacterium]
MPELPEVETIKRTLEPKVLELTVERVEIRRPDIICWPSAGEFAGLLPGRKVLSLQRRGKYLVWRLSGNYALIWHLGMTGRLVFSLPEAPQELHTHLILTFSGGQEVRFVDVRRFGRCYLGQSEKIWELAGLDKLGIEPLSEEFTPQKLKEILQGRRRSLKQLLLDQRYVSGLGNIYSDEALFEAGIHPLRQASELIDEDIVRLHSAIRKVVESGIVHGGTSIRDYVNGEGQQGNHQDYLMVYGRAGQPCVRCGTPVQRLKIGGRSSYFCPQCQV